MSDKNKIRRRSTYKKWFSHLNYLRQFCSSQVALGEVIGFVYNQLNSAMAFKSSTNAQYNLEALDLAIQDFKALSPE